jgi:hypothetical protein
LRRVTGGAKWARPSGPLPALKPVTGDGWEPRLDPVPRLGEHTDAILAEFGLRPAHLRAAPKPDPQCRHGLRSGARAVGGASADKSQAAARLRVHESGLLSPAPFLSASAVAIPELKRRSIGGRAASDVQALVERTECAVVAAPGPTLRGGSVAGENLDHRSVVPARAGIGTALTGSAEDWTGATIFRLDDGRRVEVVPSVDRLGEAQILALRPTYLSGILDRQAEHITIKPGPQIFAVSLRVVDRRPLWKIGCYIDRAACIGSKPLSNGCPPIPRKRSENRSGVTVVAATTYLRASRERIPSRVCSLDCAVIAHI